MRYLYDYIITTNSGKPFIQDRSFNISGYIGDVYVLENNKSKIRADQQVIYNNGRTSR